MRPVLILLIACALLATVAAADEPVLQFRAITGGWSRDVYREGTVPVGLEYADEPWLTERDIVAWDVSTNWITLAQDKRTLLARLHPGFAAGSHPRVGSAPFAVFVRGERCFIAEFFSMVNSASTPFLHFGEVETGQEPWDVLVLRQGREPTDLDCLVAALHELGLAQGGLKVTIEEVRVTVPPSADHALLECVLLITNKDTDDLMVPDPELMGDQFYFFSWGLRLQSVGQPEREIYRPLDGFTAGGIAHDDFLMLVPAGMSVRRTLVKATKLIPPGLYEGRLDFPGVTGAAAEGATGPGVRMWRGRVSVGPVEIVVVP